MVGKQQAILEGLKFNRQQQYPDIDSFNIIGEEVEWQPLFNGDIAPIDEANVVTFDKVTYPKEGWAVVMAGGAGSGKGFTIGHQVLIDAKVVDVDRMKELYNIKQGNKYDLRNPDDVMELHKIIELKGWKDKVINQFLNTAIQTKTLPNVIFDITGKSISSLQNYTVMAKDMGYKVCFVWVITNRGVAMIRNLLRNRVVPQSVFHQSHNQVKDSVFPFLKSDFAKFVDEAWVIFSGDTDMDVDDKAEHPSRSEKVSVRDELKNKVFKLIKKEGKFTSLTMMGRDVVDLSAKVAEFLGPDEVSYDNPQMYRSFTDLQADIDALPRDDAGNIIGKHKVKTRNFSTF